MMTKGQIFISHSDKDHTFIDNLAKALQLQGLDVWVDNKQLRAGAGLHREIKTAIRDARAFIVVFSIDALNSAWVFDETKYALNVRKKKGDGYPVIPLLMESVSPAAIKPYFNESIKSIPIGPGGISEAMPDVLVALGERSQDTVQPMLSKPKEPITELMLELTEPTLTDDNGKPRAQGGCLKTHPKPPPFDVWFGVIL
jgi:TIR domain